MKKLEKQLIKAQRRLDKLKEQAEKLKIETTTKPKIGDICKFWNANKKLFTIGKLEIIDDVYCKYLNINDENYYMNCQSLGPNMKLGEVFGKEVSND